MEWKTLHMHRIKDQRTRDICLFREKRLTSIQAVSMNRRSGRVFFQRGTDSTLFTCELGHVRHCSDERGNSGMENSPHAQNQRSKDTGHLFVSRKEINHRCGEIFCVETKCFRVRALCVLNKCDSMCMRACVCVCSRSAGMCAAELVSLPMRTCACMFVCVLTSRIFSHVTNQRERKRFSRFTLAFVNKFPYKRFSHKLASAVAINRSQSSLAHYSNLCN